jgi:hypothetical protein
MFFVTLIPSNFSEFELPYLLKTLMKTVIFLTVHFQVLIALNHYAGGQFQRITAICGGVSQSTVWRVIQRVTLSLCHLKNQHIRMPSDAEMQNTAERIAERFQIPRLALAVDGMMARFEDAPRGLPPGVRRQDWWCRKCFYAINCQIVCNDQHLICDVDCDWPGNTHDARIWDR